MMIYYSPEVFPSAQLKIGRDPKGKESFLRVEFRECISWDANPMENEVF